MIPLRQVFLALILGTLAGVFIVWPIANSLTERFDRAQPERHNREYVQGYIDNRWVNLEVVKE